MTAKNRKHHLDGRASVIADSSTGDDDDLLSSAAVADWLGVSTMWVEIGRGAGYGPKFVRIGPRRIRYRRADVVRWLKSRTYASTRDYAKPREVA